MRASFAGTGHLVRLILRRDRLILPLWIVGYAAMIGGPAPAVKGLYDTAEKIAGYRETVAGSAATQMIQGRPYDVDTIGGIIAYEVSMTAAIIITLMVLFTVVRHTRSEEETGRAELLRAGVLGRHAHTASAALVAVGASLLVGAIDAALLAAIGLGGTGSVLHGASIASLGIAFTAITATVAQVTASARLALGIGGGVLGALYVVRGIGDVEGNFLTWLSPFGWAQAIRPYGDSQWWPVLALLTLAVVVSAAAGYLTAHRDAGAGLIQPRAGRPRARRQLGTPFGMALRMQRGLILGWGTGLVLLAVIFGSFGGEVEAMVESNPEMREFFPAGEIVEAYLGYSVAFIAVLASAFGLASALRLRGEETSGRSESVLAAGVSRLRWAMGGLAVTLFGTVAILALSGLAIGGTHALTTGDGQYVAELTWAGLLNAPAVLLVAAIGVALWCWWPRWALLAWVVFGFAMFQIYFGEALELPGAVSGLSPFWHVPQLPVDSAAVTPVVILLAMAVVLVAAGLWRLRERDLVLP